MGLDKAIEHGKEKRKKYYGSKAIDCTCRNHGSCNHCLSNRLYKQLKKKLPVNKLYKNQRNMYNRGRKYENRFTRM